MTTTELDTQTDFYAKSNSTMFPIAEKLAYYVEADGILNSLIIDEAKILTRKKTQRLRLLLSATTSKRRGYTTSTG